MRTLVCLGVVLALVTAVRADEKEAKHMRGKIVRVDAANNTITVRDDNNKEQELKVGATTQFFGTDKKPLSTGLKSTEFKEGTEVWYETSATDRTMITGLHLSAPGKDK
jgi:hypothetical protein